MRESLLWVVYVGTIIFFLFLIVGLEIASNRIESKLLAVKTDEEARGLIMENMRVTRLMTIVSSIFIGVFLFLQIIGRFFLWGT
ncbi:hypothetical protein MUP01_12200 [Candidatus Bathyarchaeota archaeon]|nr:hypothetical protein [Candidatus Bathyarchaeota archaeon]